MDRVDRSNHAPQWWSWKALAALGIVWLVVALTTAALYAADVLLVLFLGILFGIFLIRCGRWIANLCGIRYTFGLSIVVILLLFVTILVSLLAGLQIHDRIDKVSEQLRGGWEEVQKLTDRYPAAEAILGGLSLNSSASGKESGGDAQQDESQGSDVSQGNQASEAAQNNESNQANEPAQNQQQAAGEIGGWGSQLSGLVRQMFRTTFGAVVNSLLIFFVGLFVAASPELYLNGTVKFFPEQQQSHAREVIKHIGATLWRWLIGRFATMAITGLGAAIVLWIAGVPMAGTLGILTGLLAFVPNIGAAVALGLAMLAAAPQGTNTLIGVVIGYTVLQLLESYIFTPLIQQHEVATPPALLLAFQALMGVWFGFLGAMTASPILAALTALLQKTYFSKDRSGRSDESTKHDLPEPM